MNLIDLAVVALMLMEHISRWKYSQMKIIGIKTALILFMIPFMSVMVIYSRKKISLHGIMYFSEFGKVITLPMQEAYVVIACIWLLGFIPGIVFRFVQ